MFKEGDKVCVSAQTGHWTVFEVLREGKEVGIVNDAGTEDLHFTRRSNGRYHLKGKSVDRERAPWITKEFARIKKSS